MSESRQPLTDSEVATNSRVADSDGGEFIVSGRVPSDQGAFLVLTPADGGGGTLVLEGTVRDQYEARENLSPEQRDAKRQELQAEIDRLNEASQVTQPSPTTEGIREGEPHPVTDVPGVTVPQEGPPAAPGVQGSEVR